MGTTQHLFSDLFAQLGLPNDERSIAKFLIEHTTEKKDFRLPDLPFWSPSQAAFLKESLVQDSEWSGLADQLSSALRAPIEIDADTQTTPKLHAALRAKVMPGSAAHNRTSGI